jgi:hypothetical protein
VSWYADWRDRKLRKWHRTTRWTWKAFLCASAVVTALGVVFWEPVYLAGTGLFLLMAGWHYVLHRWAAREEE